MQLLYFNVLVNTTLRTTTASIFKIVLGAILNLKNKEKVTARKAVPLHSIFSKILRL